MECLFTQTIDTKGNLFASCHQMNVLLVDCQLDKRLRLVDNVTYRLACLQIFSQIGIETNHISADGGFDVQIGTYAIGEDGSRLYTQESQTG